jgi:cytochrome c oxidase subunit 2
MNGAPQSTFDPAAGSGAALIHELSLALYIGAAVIFLGVMLLLARAVFSAARPVVARRWLVGGGLLFPVATLSVLLVYALAVGNALSSFNVEGPLRFLLDCISGPSRALGASAPRAGEMHIEVVGRQWWWEVRYVNAVPGAKPIVLANELRLPAGRAVEVFLTSEDVIHSFWVPSLAGKVDMIPGRRNRLVLKSDVPGAHRGQCAEYCGGQHALMSFVVEVVPEAQFEPWIARQARNAEVPRNPFLARGQDAFARNGCGACHTVRGTAAQGKLGPDLTHVGSRRTLAAGVLDNHVGTMAGWIAGTQTIKPGSAMPETRVDAGADLRALASWLESLE